MQLSFRFAKSAFVGIAATFTDMGILTVLVQLAGVPPYFAVIPSACSGSCVQFLGQRKYVFNAQGGQSGQSSQSNKITTQALLFALGEAGSWLLNALILYLFTKFTPIHFAIARLAAGAVVFAAYSYPVWRFIFRPKQAVSAST